MDKGSPDSFKDRISDQTHIIYDDLLKTDFVQSLAEDKLDKNRFHNWVSNISPFVYDFSKGLDANANRAEAFGNQKLAQRLRKRVESETLNGQLWDKLRDSMGFSRNKPDHSYSQEDAVFNLNNWLWIVNSNPSYSIPEGMAAMYGVDAILSPLFHDDGLMPNIVNMKARYYPRASLGWFESWFDDEHERRAREDLQHLALNYHSSPLASKLYNSARITQQLLVRVFEAS